ncbi:MAG TPA: phosphoribosyltransferase family protein [Acidimicrobiia bacterium]|nr:phosphoribosyltransferase family protein [Acidimicrobiia bacterium]
MRFADRHHAGELLGRAVAELDPTDPVVYALPRGGVPVGFEVARALDCPLDILVVRKIGVPFQPELAMGAIGEGNVRVRNDSVMVAAGIDDDVFTQAAERERRLLETRVAFYRADVERVDPGGKTALVVDDGLATGSTALAAVTVLASQNPAELWLAVPVAPASPFDEIEKLVDRLVIVEQPRHFAAVGSWYRDFGQTSDDEVRDLLVESRLA